MEEYTGTWSLIRVMVSSEGFGKSGDLVQDIVNLSEEHKIGSFIISGDGGHTVTGRPGNKFLLGGRSTDIPCMIELTMPDHKVQAVKQALSDLFKAGKDNGVFYQVPLVALINDTERLKDIL